jgi:hypothetical protein
VVEIGYGMYTTRQVQIPANLELTLPEHRRKSTTTAQDHH